MSFDQSKQIAQAFSWLRAMSGGKLSSDQVEAGDAIIAMNGLPTFAKVIGFSLTESAQRDISELGFQLIREFEGYSAKAYLDTGGVWTIGFGTIKYPDGKRVVKGDVCTQSEAEKWLKNKIIIVFLVNSRYIALNHTILKMLFINNYYS